MYTFDKNLHNILMYSSIVCFIGSCILYGILQPTYYNSTCYPTDCNCLVTKLNICTEYDINISYENQIGILIKGHVNNSKICPTFGFDCYITDENVTVNEPSTNINIIFLFWCTSLVFYFITLVLECVMVKHRDKDIELSRKVVVGS